MLLMHKSQIGEAAAIEPQVRACISLSFRRSSGPGAPQSADI
jgi:hypothetical protein